ncbi:PAS domain-containing protein, partial [Methylobacterium trifolii]
MGERLDHSPAPDAGDLRRVAFEEAAVGLAVLSADARLILDANRAFCDLVGLAPDGLTARPIADLLGPGGVLA